MAARHANCDRVVMYGVVSLGSGAISIGELRQALRQMSASMRRKRPDAEPNGGTLDGSDTGQHQTPGLGGDLHP